ncbi:MAG: PEP-CTERM sorting domain-containing protein [Gammaproteobacteria bacterium]|nr:PEP-CTERM sorting domain-containing protein [Gammaproteobacteria bacterium]
MSNTNFFAKGALLTLVLTVSQAAMAVPVTATLPDYSSPGDTSGFPIDLGDVGTFVFATGDMLSATLSGTWGNSDYALSSAGADVFLDGILVAQCVEFDSCWQDATGTLAWSYTFTAADLALGILDDGMANLSVIQTSSFSVRLGSLALDGEVVATPEPGIYSLLGIGMIGLVLVRRKKKA